jgi:hypothetical protein
MESVEGAVGAMSDLARSEFGYIGQKRDTVVGQTVFFESRHTRPTMNTLRVTFDKTMTGSTSTAARTTSSTTSA